MRKYTRQSEEQYQRNRKLIVPKQYELRGRSKLRKQLACKLQQDVPMPELSDEENVGHWHPFGKVSMDDFDKIPWY